MAEVKIRKLDDDVARALRTRARQRGVSLKEEARRTLSESVAKKLDAFARRAAACRAATRRPKGSALPTAPLSYARTGMRGGLAVVDANPRARLTGPHPRTANLRPAPPRCARPPRPPAPSAARP